MSRQRCHNVVKVADQHGDESAEGVAKVVVLACVEDAVAEGVERAKHIPCQQARVDKEVRSESIARGQSARAA